MALRPTRLLKPLVIVTAVAVLAVFVAALYRSELNIASVNSAAQVVALAVGAWWALNRFVLTRESSTFLDVSVAARVVGERNSAVLVVVSVRLKNIGTSRIDARTERDAAGWLYNDNWDRCSHAGTLAIRQVPEERAPLLFDWYSLEPLSAEVAVAFGHESAAAIVPTTGSLEQIDYLADYADPNSTKNEADFWLEPGETYEQTVPLWLRPGLYAFKAYFVGRLRAPGEEEYWSSTAFAECVSLPSSPLY